MSTKLTQEQKLDQSLSLTPAQIQAIKMLELTGLELESRIEHELEENPALEENYDEGESDSPDSELEASEGETSDQDWELGEYATEDDIPEYKLRELQERQAVREEIPFAAGAPSLDEYLLEQLSMVTPLEGDREEIARYIIGNIDADGYLTRSELEIEDDLLFKAGITPPPGLISEFIQLIKTLDPAGIGASDLRECLLLQLKKKRPTPDTALALRILNEHFDAFTRKHYEKIRRALDLDEATLKAVLREITRLNPKPGNGWNEASDTAMNRITPDFIVDCHNGQLSLSMNQRDAPELHVNREYADMFRDYLGNKSNRSPEMRNAVQFVKQKLDAARWFIDAVRQRRETLQRTMEAILMLQTDFFLTGDETKLRPMILKDVAEHAGYDISTVSRVSNSKYVQTNFGIYPLKFFFSEGVLNDQGEEISTREIKKIMRETIDAEDKRNPVTDEALCALLRAKGYTPARRTVAKYREQLGIPVARLRKEL